MREKLDVTRGYIETLNREGGTITEDNSLTVHFRYADVNSDEQLKTRDYVEFGIYKTRDQVFAKNM